MGETITESKAGLSQIGSPENLLDYVPYSPSEESILNEHSQGLFARLKKLNSDLLESRESGGNTTDIESDIKDVEFIDKAVTEALNAQQYENNAEMTVSDILAKRALVAQSKIEKWTESDTFPINWEDTVRERNLLDIAIDQIQSIKMQKEQSGHFMINPNRRVVNMKISETNEIVPRDLEDRQEDLREVQGTVESEQQTERLTVDMLRNILRQKELAPEEIYNKLTSYVESRVKDLGIKKPVHVFLRSEYFEKTTYGSTLKKVRFDPIKQEVFSGSWSWQTRAFHSDNGTYLDFPANQSGNPENKTLYGYEAADSMIDFIYTCEHELRHDLQFQKLDAKEVSYDALRLAKDQIAINLISQIENGENFYNKAHDDFFIEIDANDQANEYMDKIFPSGSSLANNIANPNDPSAHQHTLTEIVQKRTQEGTIGSKKYYSLSLGKNKIGLPSRNYEGSVEQIVSDFCDEALMVYPDYIKLYPALALEYKNDGSRRSVVEIKDILKNADQSSDVSIFDQKVDSKRLKVIYHRLIKDSQKLQLEQEKPI